jgi:ABC-2 type transport system permease protein
MNSTLVSGIIIWNDRRHGMFEQIMSGPFTRSNYILSNITTIAIVGLVSAALIAAVGYPVFFQSVEFSLVTIPLIVFSSIVGAILFGSIERQTFRIVKLSLIRGQQLQYILLILKLF